VILDEDDEITSAALDISTNPAGVEAEITTFSEKYNDLVVLMNTLIDVDLETVRAASLCIIEGLRAYFTRF
jgi:flagellar capping protein FliD